MRRARQAQAEPDATSEALPPGNAGLIACPPSRIGEQALPRRCPRRTGAQSLGDNLPNGLRTALALALLLAFTAPAGAQGISAPLTATPGDPAHGRSIVGDRTVGLCILCHAAPLPEVPFMGDLAPGLAGVGSRLSVPELRERIVDSRRVNPDSIMPPYHSLANLTRVGSRWEGTTILTAQQVEDVVAYLATLTEDGDDR